MGFFSYRCAVTGRPILAGETTWPEDLEPYTRVVLVTRKGWMRGTYDGYGRIGADACSPGRTPDDFPSDLSDLAEEPRLVLAHAFTGQAYGDLKPSGHEPNQGFFWDDDELRDVVNDLYPYPGTPFGESGLAGALECLRGSTAAAACIAGGDGRWTISTDPASIDAAIAAEDAIARSEGLTPSRRDACAALRDVRAAVAGTREEGDVTRVAGIDPGTTVRLDADGTALSLSFGADGAVAVETAGATATLTPFGTTPAGGATIDATGGTAVAIRFTPVEIPVGRHRMRLRVDGFRTRSLIVSDGKGLLAVVRIGAIVANDGDGTQDGAPET